MHRSLSPFMTTGIAIVATGALVAAPALSPAPAEALASPTITAEVAPAASFDPITPWLEVFNTSEVNFAALANYWLEAPLPVVQQVIANQIGYLGELPDIGGIIEQIWANVQAGAAAPFEADPDLLDSTHGLIYAVIGALLNPGDDPLVGALVDFLASPVSGILIGAVGPVVSPLLALGDSIQAIVAELTGPDPDLVAAFNELVNIPAAITGAVLNGYGQLELTPLLSLVGDILPPEITINSVNLAMGGLLSPAGSLFNTIGLDVEVQILPPPFPPTSLGFAGNPAGPIGSLIAMTNAIAEAIGWDGMGNPLAPPLSPPPAPVMNVSTVPSEEQLAVEAVTPVEGVENDDEVTDGADEATGTADEATDEVTDEAAVKAAEQSPVASTEVEKNVELDVVSKAERDEVPPAASEAIKEAVEKATDRDSETKVGGAVKTGRQDIKKTTRDAVKTVSEKMTERREAVKDAVKDRRTAKKTAGAGADS